MRSPHHMIRWVLTLLVLMSLSVWFMTRTAYKAQAISDVSMTKAKVLTRTSQAPALSSNERRGSQQRVRSRRAGVSESGATLSQNPAPQSSDRPSRSRSGKPVLSPIFERYNVFIDTDLKQAIRDIDREETATLPVLLQSLGPEHALTRDKVITLAGKLDDSSLTPLWANLLERQTPRFSNEDALLAAPHPGLEVRLIHLEQLQAIRKLGQLAFSDSKAHELLTKAALNHLETPLSTLLRERAMMVLRESDPKSSLMILAKLETADPLRTRLKNHRKAEHP